MRGLSHDGCTNVYTGRGFICARGWAVIGARVQLAICTRVMFRIHGNYRQIGPVICARGNKKGMFCMVFPHQKAEGCSSFQTSRLPSTQPHPPHCALFGSCEHRSLPPPPHPTQLICQGPTAN